MKHIKREFTLKAWVRAQGVDSGDGAKAKIKLFQNMIMLHIKLKLTTFYSNMVVNVLSTDTYNYILIYIARYLLKHIHHSLMLSGLPANIRFLQASLTRKCHSYRLTTDLWHHENWTQIATAYLKQSNQPYSSAR